MPVTIPVNISLDPEPAKCRLPGTCALPLATGPPGPGRGSVAPAGPQAPPLAQPERGLNPVIAVNQAGREEGPGQLTATLHQQGGDSLVSQEAERLGEAAGRGRTVTPAASGA